MEGGLFGRLFFSATVGYHDFLPRPSFKSQSGNGTPKFGVWCGESDSAPREEWCVIPRVCGEFLEMPKLWTEAVPRGAQSGKNFPQQGGLPKVCCKAVWTLPLPSVSLIIIALCLIVLVVYIITFCVTVLSHMGQWVTRHFIWRLSVSRLDLYGTSVFRMESIPSKKRCQIWGSVVDYQGSFPIPV